MGHVKGKSHLQHQLLGFKSTCNSLCSRQAPSKRSCFPSLSLWGSVFVTFLFFSILFIAGLPIANCFFTGVPIKKCLCRCTHCEISLQVYPSLRVYPLWNVFAGVPIMNCLCRCACFEQSLQVYPKWVVFVLSLQVCPKWTVSLCWS